MTAVRNRLALAHARPAADAGWTLIELLVVLSLILVITGFAASSRSTAVSMGREAALRANLQMMRDAIDQFYADTASYPTTLEELVTTGYVRAIPEDPFTGSATTWETEPPPSPLGSGRPRDGVYQVRSGAEHTGLDGTRVSTW